MKSEYKTIIQLGSNLGDRFSNLESAIGFLEDFGMITLKSGVYETEAWGEKNQSNFYNQLVEFRTNLNPYSLLKSCLLIENKMGRKRDFKWGPRIIDLDIIFYSNKIIFSPELKIPHPFYKERRFILEPLCELDSDFIDPLTYESMEKLLANCKDNGAVKRLDQ